MILQFTVSNYRCFREPQTLSFLADSDDSLPGNVIGTEFPGLSGKRWLRGAGLYGANASGKSTVLRALDALRNLVTHSAKTTDERAPIEVIEPFALCPEHENVPTAFGLVFVQEGVRYEYRVAATRARIVHESLRAFPVGREQIWYSRDWNQKDSCYEWSPDKPTGFRRDSKLEGYTLKNMLFLSKAVANNKDELKPVFNWFTDRLCFLDLSASSNMPHSFSLKQFVDQTPMAERILAMMCHADIGVTGVGVAEQGYTSGDIQVMASKLNDEAKAELLNQKFKRPVLEHAAQHQQAVALSWDVESAGTQRFFSLIGPWLDILQSGRIVCIDELETSMHPLMVRELLRLFFNEEQGTNNAQIVFTTHNPLLLDQTLLRRDQILFTDKDQEGAAHLYPLTDYSPRKNESLMRGYLSGRYGAVPFIPTGLFGHVGNRMDATSD